MITVWVSVGSRINATLSGLWSIGRKDLNGLGKFKSFLRPAQFFRVPITSCLTAEGLNEGRVGRIHMYQLCSRPKKSIVKFLMTKEKSANIFLTGLGCPFR